MSRNVAIVAPVNAMQIETEAQQILQSFQPGALVTPQAIQIEKFFEGRLPKMTGVITDYRDLSPGILGWTDSERMEVVVAANLVDSLILSERRRGRATIAHECDHAIRHIPQFRKRQNILKSIHDSNHSNFRMFRQEDIPAYLNPEWQSWRWAKAFLMPLPTVINLFRYGSEPYEMAEIFDVNPAFVKTRLADLTRMNKI